MGQGLPAIRRDWGDESKSDALDGLTPPVPRAQPAAPFSYSHSRHGIFPLKNGTDPRTGSPTFRAGSIASARTSDPRTAAGSSFNTPLRASSRMAFHSGRSKSSQPWKPNHLRVSPGGRFSASHAPSMQNVPDPHSGSTSGVVG